MNHAELVERAVYWLMNKGHCTVAFSEFATAAMETPDAIGFRNRYCTVVECKTSRPDFFRDQKKIHRRRPEMSMGSMRYYLVPSGLVSPGELPDGWGLLYAYDESIKVVAPSKHFDVRNYYSELAFMCSMLRRLEIRAIDQYRKQGNKTWQKDFLNQWIKQPVERR